MVLKKKVSSTTEIRYRMKMYGVAIGKAVGNEQLATEYAISLSVARAAGFQALSQAHDVVNDVLSKAGVPRGLWGIYYAFSNFYVSKVLGTGTYTVDEAITHFSRLGADAGLLTEIANQIAGITSSASSPKPKKG